MTPPVTPVGTRWVWGWVRSVRPSVRPYVPVGRSGEEKFSFPNLFLCLYVYVLACVCVFESIFLLL